MARGSFAWLGSGADVECGRKQVRRQVQWFAGTSYICWEGARSHAELTEKMSSDGQMDDSRTEVQALNLIDLQARFRVQGSGSGFRAAKDQPYEAPLKPWHQFG
jgi:hypothetical protein